MRSTPASAWMKLDEWYGSCLRAMELASGIALPPKMCLTKRSIFSSFDALMFHWKMIADETHPKIISKKPSPSIFPPKNCVFLVWSNYCNIENKKTSQKIGRPCYQQLIPRKIQWNHPVCWPLDQSSSLGRLWRSWVSPANCASWRGLCIAEKPSWKCELVGKTQRVLELRETDDPGGWPYRDTPKWMVVY